MATFWVDLATANPKVTVIATDSDANGTILAVGDASLASQRRRGDRVESLAGGFVTPGFWDSHVHLLEWGRNFSRLQFQPNDSKEAVLSQVHRRSQEISSTDWIIGTGWNLQAFTAPPDMRSLDDAAGSHPAVLLSLDYHTVWLNHKAMAQLGIHGDEARQAEDSGLLREDRAFWAQEQTARAANPSNEAVVRTAVHSAARAGLVGVTAMEDRQGLAALQEPGALGGDLRVELFLREQTGRALAKTGISQGFGNDLLKIMGVKLFADGALGSHTAWMHEPYTDEPDNWGINTMSPMALQRWALRLARSRLLAAVHAIGDRAVHEVVEVLSAAPAPGESLHRIEHAQLMADSDLNRLIGTAVGLSMQPVHLLVDREIADQHWGERSRHAFRFADILRAGIPLAFGSDAPIATLDPVPGLWAAVHRARPGDNPWYAEQRLTPDQAIWCYTRGPAVLDGRPSGLIEPGFWGDFTVWREDPRVGLAQGEIERLAVVATVVAGQRVF